MKKCPRCGTVFDGTYCPECGAKIIQIKKCPNCGTKAKIEAKFCVECGYSYEKRVMPKEYSQWEEPPKKQNFQEEQPKKQKGSFIAWLKSHIKIVIPVSIILLLFIILVITIPTCIAAKDNGTYYNVGYDGEIDKKTYITLKSGKWSDKDGDGGTYKKNGDKIVFYFELFGEKEEFCDGTVKDGVLKLKIFFAEDVYVSEKHKHKYGEWEVTSEATCTVDGVKTCTCTCGAKKKSTIESSGSHKGNWKTIKEATCTGAGTRSINCTACGQTITERIEATGHKIDKDWSFDGTNHYKICSVCEEKFEQAKHDDTNSCSICGYPYEYKQNSKNTGYIFRLSSFAKTEDKFVIPSSFNNLPVTSIGDYAFKGCSGLTSVTIPDSVTYIEWDAFAECSGLTSIYYTGDIASWCGIAGLGNLAKSKVYIGNKKLRDMTSITIPDSVTKICDSAFSDCSKLTSITIPNSVTSIGMSAFADCIGLSEIAIPDGVTSIGYGAFWCCSGLTNITIPDSVTSIDEDAFYGTAWYNNQPDGLVYAGKVAYAYRGTMPDNTSITLKEDTKSIADKAFRGCSGLTSITIPNSVTSIGRYVFYDCGWPSFTFNGTIEQWEAIKKDSTWKSIGSYIVQCTDGILYKDGMTA